MGNMITADLKNLQLWVFGIIEKRGFFFKKKNLPYIMQKEAAYPTEQRAINGCKGTTSKCPLILDQCFFFFFLWY